MFIEFRFKTVVAVAFVVVVPAVTFIGRLMVRVTMIAVPLCITTEAAALLVSKFYSNSNNSNSNV